MTSQNTPTAAARSALCNGLTFHVSFDHGPDADFGAGDRQMYSVSPGAEPKAIVLTPGPGAPALILAEGQGRYGAALAFARENTHTVSYRAAGNVAYAEDGFRGTISFWLRGDTAEIPGQYCDPLQLTDKDYSDACIWVDITKNDTPPDMRLGVFGNQKEWDLTDTRHENGAFYWRLVKVAEPPLARDRWTHLAITWDGINTAAGGRGAVLSRRRVQRRVQPDPRTIHVGHRQYTHQSWRRRFRRDDRRLCAVRPPPDAR